ncbi:MAG: hypothetical protein LBG16_00950 [Elusimicrobiota bacterium]|jgi:hypothetical protein|nr:hypothetical protein [Elusimicrobiota bacterium]
MKKLILFFVLAFAFSPVFAAGGAAALPVSLSGAEPEEDDADIKKLVLRYDAAKPAQKPAVRREIEKLAAAREAQAVKKTDERIKRQEAKIKEIKKNNDERKKNAANIAAKKVDYLLSKESVEKIKNEGLKQSVEDEAKNRK